jgi:hypothetical protein
MGNAADYVPLYTSIADAHFQHCCKFLYANVAGTIPLAMGNNLDPYCPLGLIHKIFSWLGEKRGSILYNHHNIIKLLLFIIIYFKSILNLFFIYYK